MKYLYASVPALDLLSNAGCCDVKKISAHQFNAASGNRSVRVFLCRSVHLNKCCLDMYIQMYMGVFSWKSRLQSLRRLHI